MVGLHSLWLPILLSSVFVFLASSLIHMVFRSWHGNDLQAVPDQDRVQDALRPFNIKPGDYILPRGKNMEEMKTPEFDEKLKKGPVIVMTVMPSAPMAMGQSLVMWFLYSVGVSVFAAYIGGRALPGGADYLDVFRFVGTTAFVGYTMAYWPMWIWFKRSFTTTLKDTVDGLIYALITAGTFGWLWPHMKPM